MDDKLSKLLDGNYEKFNDWIEKINAFYSIYDDEKQHSNEEQTNLFHEASGVLAEISELFFKYGAFKDKFDTSKMYLNFDGPSLIIKSEKTESTFHFTIGSRGISLDTDLRFAENLRHMDDSFYNDILLLEKLGNFEVIQHEHYGRETTNKYPGIFNNHKSKLFNIFRNYFVGTAERSDNIFFGSFQITWSYETDFYELVANSCATFQTLYRLNYNLWKIGDLQAKKNQIHQDKSRSINLLL